jgi:hypothetical protein
MKERERIMVTGMVALMLVTWFGFAFHESHRFAGSVWGGVLAVGGASLMLVPLLYLFIKRIPPLRKMITRLVPMRTLLAWHIYAGVAGPILVLLHTGHKFESAVGIALTGLTLVVVVSGFVGRYLMSYLTQEEHEKQETLAGLHREYDALAGELRTNPQAALEVSVLRSVHARVLTWALASDAGAARLNPGVRALRLAESIADLEYAVGSHHRFKRAFGAWLKFHIVISFVLYGLLGLHVWSAVYFGLRWFA